MKHKGIRYEFKARPWLYSGSSGWHFISFPQEFAEEIRNTLGSEEQGWGRLKATASIGSSEWKTSIWFDTKMKTYLLPLKAAIRKKENIQVGREIKTVVWI